MKKSVIILIIALLLLAVVLYVQNGNNLFPINESIKHNYTNFSSAYPLVFVHGWMGKARDYDEYARQVQEDGIAEYKGTIDRYTNESVCPDKWPSAVSISAEYYYNYNYNVGIEEYADELSYDIDLVLKCTDAKQVIIIAHSMGGLVARKYLDDDNGRHVNKLITLATPHYGFNEFTKSEIILMILDVITGRKYEIEQMRPDSEFLKKLDKEDKEYRYKMVSIGTYTLDNSTLLFDLPVLTEDIRAREKQLFANTDIIVPLDSTKLAGAKYYQIQGCSHTQITNIRHGEGKGPINEVKACPDAYELVKKEIFASAINASINISVIPANATKTNATK
jgi:pimeloyl-ACP methyl ester carboxylesterase